MCGLPTDPQLVTLFRADCQEGLTSVSTLAAGEYMAPKPTSCSFPVPFPHLEAHTFFLPSLPQCSLSLKAMCGADISAILYFYRLDQPWVCALLSIARKGRLLSSGTLLLVELG